MPHSKVSVQRSSRFRIASAIMLFLLLAAACAPVRQPPATPLPPDDLGAARSTLLSFFVALNEGRYADAASLYGGSYEELRYMNPDLNPADAVALWEQGCKHNGFQCFKIKEVVEAAQTSPGEYRFKVRFEARDGGTFVLGPCCGATEAEQPPLEVFEYVVAPLPGQAGAFRVQGLPVYMP